MLYVSLCPMSSFLLTSDRPTQPLRSTVCIPYPLIDDLLLMRHRLLSNSRGWPRVLSKRILWLDSGSSGQIFCDEDLTLIFLQPPFVLCVICMLIVGFHSDKVRHLECQKGTVTDASAEERAISPHCVTAHIHCCRQHHCCLHAQRCGTM